MTPLARRSWAAAPHWLQALLKRDAMDVAIMQQDISSQSSNMLN
jgi:hypothetical protein